HPIRHELRRRLSSPPVPEPVHALPMHWRVASAQPCAPLPPTRLLPPGGPTRDAIRAAASSGAILRIGTSCMRWRFALREFAHEAWRSPDVHPLPAAPLQ